MYDELKDKGLGLVAVNGTDSAETINKYVKENNFTFTAAQPIDDQRPQRRAVLTHPAPTGCGTMGG